MDMNTVKPLIGELLNASSPAISTVLQMAVGEIPFAGGVAGPLVGLAAPRIISMIAGQLGVNDPDASADTVAQKVVDTIKADPDAAASKLAALESEHKFVLDNRDRDIAAAQQQIGLLTQDATSSSWLARNWRPLTALGLSAFLGFQLLLPYLVWLATWAGGHPPPGMPEPRFDVTVSLVSGILGLGVMRTADKLGTTSAIKTTANAAAAVVASKARR